MQERKMFSNADVENAGLADAPLDWLENVGKVMEKLTILLN